MRHSSLASLPADAGLSIASPTMTYVERRARWVEALAREPNRMLKPLSRVEFVPKRQRGQIRTDDSPLSVAYADPVLRAEGLASDRFGDAAAFFGLGSGAMHALVCECHYGGLMRARSVARRVRWLAYRNPVLRFAGRLAL